MMTVRARPSQRGSAVLLTLFLCLAAALLVAGAGTVIRLGQVGIAEERAGWRTEEDVNEAFSELSERARGSWEPSEFVWDAEEDAYRVSLDSAEVAGPGDEGASRGWGMHARVEPESRDDGWGVSGWIERGRDGLDLPPTMVTASRITAAPSRELPWLEMAGEEDTEGPEDSETPGEPETPEETEGLEDSEPAALIATRWEPPAGALDESFRLKMLSQEWRLDEGWRIRLEEEHDIVGGDALSEGASANSAADWDGSVIVEHGSHGSVISLAGLRSGLSAEAGARPEDPLLVVLYGGATLDARFDGDLFAVLVSDDGSMLLDGTNLHGAVYVTGTLALAESGVVTFSNQIYRWATDRSLRLVRVAPGSRREGAAEASTGGQPLSR